MSAHEILVGRSCMALVFASLFFQMIKKKKQNRKSRLLPRWIVLQMKNWQWLLTKLVFTLILTEKVEHWGEILQKQI